MRNRRQTIEIDLSSVVLEAHQKGSYCARHREAVAKREDLTRTWDCLPTVEQIEATRREGA